MKERYVIKRLQPKYGEHAYFDYYFAGDMFTLSIFNALHFALYEAARTSIEAIEDKNGCLFQIEKIFVP